jgi:hypothetical protein
MSQPISKCLIFKAALGDEKAFDTLVRAQDYNSTQFAFTVFPCECNPRCAVPSDEQLEDLGRRVAEALAALRKNRQKCSTCRIV